MVRLVAEQRHARCVSICLQPLCLQPGFALEGGALLHQVRLAQQAAGGRREAGIEEPLGATARGAAHDGRCQPVAALDIGLGAQVFEVDQTRCGSPWGGFAAAPRPRLGLSRSRRPRPARRRAQAPGQGGGVGARPVPDLDVVEGASACAGCHPVEQPGLVGHSRTRWPRAARLVARRQQTPRSPQLSITWQKRSQVSAAEVRVSRRDCLTVSASTPALIPPPAHDRHHPNPCWAVAALPALPGVYRYFDADGQLLYVGKGWDLKRRVSSYFQKTHDGTRIGHMVARSGGWRPRWCAPRPRRCCSRTT